MKYLLKVANGDGKGYFELVNKYTYDNHKFALSDDGLSPRYELNDWVMVGEDGSISMQLTQGNPQDLAILIRGLELPPSPAKVEGGFIREPVVIKFCKGRSITMLELKTGEMWTKKAA
jgi:hypothetical protein